MIHRCEQAAPAQRRWEKSLRLCLRGTGFPADDLVLHHPLDEGATPLVRDIEQSRLGRKTQSDDEAKTSPKKVEVGFKGGVPRYAASPLGQAAAFDGQALV